MNKSVVGTRRELFSLKYTRPQLIMTFAGVGVIPTLLIRSCLLGAEEGVRQLWKLHDYRGVAPARFSLPLLTGLCVLWCVAAQVRKTAGRHLIRLGDQDIDVSPAFTLFLSTRDPTARFAPDLCGRVTARPSRHGGPWGGGTVGQNAGGGGIAGSPPPAAAMPAWDRWSTSPSPRRPCSPSACIAFWRWSGRMSMPSGALFWPMGKGGPHVCVWFFLFLPGLCAV